MGTVAAPPPSNARKGAYVKHMQAIHKEQHRSIQQKHGQEMVLLDSIKGFFKQRFALERQHFEALSKICSSQCRAFDCIKKLPNSDPDNPNEVSQKKMVKFAKYRVTLCNLTRKIVPVANAEIIAIFLVKSQ